MPFRLVTPALALGLALFCGIAGTSASAQPVEVEAVTEDGVSVYGTLYTGKLSPSAPIILLFHQAGSNGRGEYAGLIPWLNAEGFRVIAWDQRSGGSNFGQTNRTVAGLPPGTPSGFCDAYPDLQAALDFVTTQGLGDEVVLWGSSYSAALVVRLAAENPDVVAGVLAFSPASGGPMAPCRARAWIDRVVAPVAAFRPASEMERTSSQEQRELFEAAGAEVFVVEHGVHGSSLLVDARTGHDMSEARALVAEWLHGLAR